MEESVTVLGRADGPRGEVLLRRRGTGAGAVEELVVNGVFAMDSTETSSERELAGFARAGRTPHPRVLVGGLGLGVTAATLLDDPLVAAGAVDVVELEEALVGWARAGVTPTLSRVADDPRVSLHAADVTQVLRGDAPAPRGPWDAVLLDVDNGPDFLIHHANDRLYRDTTLRAAHDQLTPGGVLAIWCQGPAPDLHRRLRTIGPSRAHHHRVQRQGRSFSYVIYTLERTPAGSATAGPAASPGPG